MSLFLLLFKLQHSFTTQTQGHGLINTVHVIHSFGMFLESLKHFKKWFFLVVPFHKEAHATMCNVGTGVEDRCISQFPKYLNKCHFLMGNGLYVYKTGNISQEELYLKRIIVNFVKELGYVRVSLLKMRLLRNVSNGLVKCGCWWMLARRRKWRLFLVIFRYFYPSSLIRLSVMLLPLVITISIFNEEWWSNSRTKSGNLTHLCSYRYFKHFGTS